MITFEQIERIETETTVRAAEAFQTARTAERQLEDYTYGGSGRGSRGYDPVQREKLLQEFQEADYQAESQAWILLLIKAAKKTLN